MRSSSVPGSWFLVLGSPSSLVGGRLSFIVHRSSVVGAKAMNVLIVGGGKVGKNLAHFLVEQDGHTVTLLERSEAVALMLAAELPSALVVEGDGCDPAVLREAGVERVNAVVAVTGDDEDNLVIALLSKREFHVGRVAARINNPKNAWLFNQRMGVDVPVDDTWLIARSLEADINFGVR